MLEDKFLKTTRINREWNLKILIVDKVSKYFLEVMKGRESENKF